jgi:hypothetical protein
VEVGCHLFESNDHSEITSVPEGTSVGLHEMVLELVLAPGLGSAAGVVVQTGRADSGPVLLHSEPFEIGLDNCGLVDQEVADW